MLWRAWQSSYIESRECGLGVVCHTGAHTVAGWAIVSPHARSSSRTAPSSRARRSATSTAARPPALGRTGDLSTEWADQSLHLWAQCIRLWVRCPRFAESRAYRSTRDSESTKVEWFRHAGTAPASVFVFKLRRSIGNGPLATGRQLEGPGTALRLRLACHTVTEPAAAIRLAEAATQRESRSRCPCQPRRLGP